MTVYKSDQCQKEANSEDEPADAAIFFARASEGCQSHHGLLKPFDSGISSARNTIPWTESIQRRE